MLNFDPYNEKDFGRLVKTVRWNYDQQKPFRKVRSIVAEQARGHYYNCKDSSPTARRNPVNMLDQWINTLVRSFVQANPTCRVSNPRDPKKAFLFQSRLNRAIVEVDLQEVLRRCVREALLGYVGTAFVGLSPSELMPQGEPFVDSLSLEDVVFDMSRGDFSMVDIEGHRFQRRIDNMLETGLYDNEVLEKHRGSHEDSSEMRDQPGNMIDRKSHDLFDWINVWTILVRPLNMVVTYPDVPGVLQPIRVESYDGPEYGPYVRLAFDTVPDQIMPNSRGALLLDQHEFVNGQYRRVMMKEDQAAEIFTYEGGAEEDARRIRNAADGEFIRVENNAGVQRRTKGGTNPQQLATAMHSRSLFDEMSGHIRSLSGGGPVAETATQERIAFQNTSQMVRDMQLQVISFTKKILQNIAWLEWTDPLRTENIERKVGRQGHAVQEMWGPEQREGDFTQYDIEIVPDSLEHRSSRQQLSELMQAVQGVLIPLMQVPTDSPVTIKVPELVAKYAELAHLPEMSQVADYALDDMFVSPPAAQSSGGNRLPAGATSQGRMNGGARPPGGINESDVVDRVLAGAIQSGGGGDEG